MRRALAGLMLVLPLSACETGLGPAPSLASYSVASVAVDPGAGSGQLGDWTKQAHATFGDFATADVVIVGDSITALGWSELQAALAARGIALAGSYWSGRPTTAAVDWATSLSRKPRVLVMASGTNDIFDPLVMTGQIARLKAWAGSSTVLVWVDVFAARPGRTEKADRRNAALVNDQIRANLPASSVCSWSMWFAKKPSREGAYLKDGIHPVKGVGTAFWTAVVAGCI